VFAGGWTLEAASEVCSGTPITKDDLVYVLIGLIEQSLVVVEEDGDRYRMLETVRQYAREVLELGGGASFWHTRHLEHFVALGEKIDPLLRGDEQQAWLDRLEMDHDNLRAALAWACDGDGDATLGLRLAEAVWWLWLVRGYWTEGIGYLCATIEASLGDRGADLTRAKALNAAGALLVKQDDYRAACVRFEQALTINRELGDQRGVAMSLTNLGNAAREQGNYAEARAFHEEALSIYRALGPRWSEAIALGNLGIDVCDQGDYPYATTCYEQALAIFRERGDRRSIALALNFLGIAARQQGKYPQAKALHEESLALFRELGDRWGIAWAQMHLGKLALAQNDHDSALVLFKESLATQQEIGERLGVTETLEDLGYVAFHRSGCGRAIVVWAVAERLRKEIGARASPGERARYEEQVAVVRAAVGDDTAFDVMWREGSVMTLAQAIEWALSDEEVR
jgi:tetratricopeptide (TPR) repeat protein